MSSPSSNTKTRARCRSTSNTPMSSYCCATASSWPTAGMWLTTTRLRTGTGSAMTSHSPWAVQENIASPRVDDRSIPAFTNSSMRRRSAATDASPLARRPRLAQEDVEFVLEVLVSQVPAAVDVEVDTS